MKCENSFLNMQFGRSFSLLSLLLLIFALSVDFVPSGFASDEISASVLEIEGVVESKMPDGNTRVLEPGDFIKMEEELNLKQESRIVLMMADSTVRKFNGPATLIMKEDLREAEGSILARLGSAIVGMLFAKERETSEKAMVTRKFESLTENKSYLPLLIHPAPGSRVLDKPLKFKWRKIEGIPLYRLSVYSWDRLLWQGTTSDSEIECPAENCSFKPGELYYWVVEALIGNSSLRSKAAEFKILPENVGVELQQTLADPKLSLSSKIRLCLSLNLYDRALDLVDSHWKGRSFDRNAYLLRAEIKEKMGLFEDAFLDYRNALSTAPAK